MWSNDFEGEACLELCQLPGVRDELIDGEQKNLPTIELYLTNPKSKNFQKLKKLKLTFK